MILVSLVVRQCWTVVVVLSRCQLFISISEPRCLHLKANGAALQNVIEIHVFVRRRCTGNTICTQDNVSDSCRRSENAE